MKELEIFSRKNRKKRRWKKIMAVLSLIVALSMSYVLVLPAITITKETYCGYEMHLEHDEGCYEETKTLICDFTEEGHMHSESCYEENSILTCSLDEYDGHTHEEECFDENGEPICGIDEGEGAHYHDDSCYVSDKELVCGQEETEQHIHDDSCYLIQKELTCSMPLHEHTSQCYSNPELDFENEGDDGQEVIDTEDPDSKNEEAAGHEEISTGDEELTEEILEGEIVPEIALGDVKPPLEKEIIATASDGAIASVFGVLPEDAEVSIIPIVMNEDLIAAYIGSSESITVQNYVVYDITIWSNGVEWQPDESVQVKISRPGIEINEDESFAVAHIDDDGNAKNVIADIDDDGSIAFSADGFSLYIIYTYTVDFHYGSLTYSIQGASSILLSELFEALGIGLEFSKVVDVVFSNNRLIRIEKIIDADNLRDWKLISLEAFDTMEELTIAFEDGSTITIHVTDANEGSTPLSPTESPDYIGTYPTGTGSTVWQITAEQYAGRSQSQKIPVDSDDDGKTDVYLQKNVVPTAKENEFLVYLSVDKQTTWEEFLNDSRVAITTSNSYKNDPPGTVYSSIHGNVTAELAEHGNQGSYSNRYYIRFNVWQNRSSAQPLYSYYDWRYGNTSNCSNASAFLRIPGLGYICVAKEVNLHVAGNGQGNPFVLDIYLSDGLQSDLTFFNTEFTEVSDVLGENIEFLEILNSDGSATYDEEMHTITWTPVDWQTVIPDFTYPPLGAWMENVVQMVYRVRLNVEADGFISCADTLDSKENSIAFGESNMVNEDAMLVYDKIALPGTNGFDSIYGLEAEFPKPQVRGLLYDIAFIKENESGRALSGAVFGLYEADGITPVMHNGEPWTETTDAGGIGRFAGIPYGEYVLKELEAPEYYTPPEQNEWDITLCYTNSPISYVQDESPYEHNVRLASNDVNGQWHISNNKIDFVYKLEVHKVDQMNNSLADVIFAASDPQNENQFLTAQTDESGECRFVAEYKPNIIYTLSEESPPPGFYPLPEDIQFRINEDAENDTYTVELINEDTLSDFVSLELQKIKNGGSFEYVLVFTVQNSTGYALPSTGGHGSFVYIGTGTALIIGVLVYGCKRRRVEGR